MRYETSLEVFVAMPFTDGFKQAFEKVIEPAIKTVSISGRSLTARIINRATSGSPDIHEKIYDAILHSRLVIADMTVQASCALDDGKPKWYANPNVAYEVGLASTWRNPEDILLIHQPHSEHSYSFDVQNLRHVSYDATDATASATLAQEIVRAINQSKFLATQTFRRILLTTSPTAVQFMHQEVQRAFPVVAFNNTEMSLMDARLHAASELLSVGALVNRNVIRGSKGGANIIYKWTELGLRMLQALNAASAERVHELREQIASVPEGRLPPRRLMDIPSPATEEKPIDIVDASKVELGADAKSKQ